MYQIQFRPAKGLVTSCSLIEQYVQQIILEGDVLGQFDVVFTDKHRIADAQGVDGFMGLRIMDLTQQRAFTDLAVTRGIQPGTVVAAGGVVVTHVHVVQQFQLILLLVQDQAVQNALARRSWASKNRCRTSTCCSPDSMVSASSMIRC